MVDVEINHRDPRKTVHGAGVLGADGDIVEQAKAHGARRFGVVAGRAHGAKRVLRRPRCHRVDRRQDRARGMQRGFARRRRHGGVGIEMDLAALGHRGEDGVDVGRRVNAFDLGALGARRLVPRKPSEFLGLERRENDPQALGPFRVKGARVVLKACGMGEQPARHGRNGA